MPRIRPGEEAPSPAAQEAAVSSPDPARFAKYLARAAAKCMAEAGSVAEAQLAAYHLYEDMVEQRDRAGIWRASTAAEQWYFKPHIVGPQDEAAVFPHGHGAITEAVLFTDGRPQVAAAYLPGGNHLYLAENGSASYNNEGLYSRLVREPQYQSGRYTYGVRPPHRSIPLVWYLLQIASGRQEYCLFRGAPSDDIAAGALLLENARGYITTGDHKGFSYDSNKPMTILAARTKEIHTSVLQRCGGKIT